MSSNKEWVPLESKMETIKVRFGSDVELPLKFTRNGVIISNDFLDGSAHDLCPWVSKDIFQNDEVDGTNVAYALGNVYDPIVSVKFDWPHPDLNFKLVFDVATQRKSLTGQEFVD